jgi:hypothetical protein
MASGRTDLVYVDADGYSKEIPWSALGKLFRENMPKKLKEWMDLKESVDTDPNLSEKELQRFLDRFLDETKPLPPKPKAVKALPVSVSAGAAGDADQERSGVKEETGDPVDQEGLKKGRGPIVNPGVTHPPGPGEQRKGPSTRTRLIEKPKPGGTLGVVRDETCSGDTGPCVETPPPPAAATTPQAPHALWVMEEAQWPEDHEKWGVIWEEPGSANDQRGKVKLNWNHWYVQEEYKRQLERTQKEHATKKMVKGVFLKSVLSKIVHRRQEAARLGLTDEELSVMFSPMVLSGFLMGWWDHADHLSAGTKMVKAAEDDEPEDEVAM